MSTAYYDQNARAFFQDTVNADMGELRARFLRHVRQGGSILDAGCGSGRDALAFSRAGFTVTAFDGSAAMVGLATEHSGLPVVQMTFHEATWREAFDGIWACASLLHVARSELPAVLAQLTGGLRHGGALFASFKAGESERDVGGRRFTDMTEQLLGRLVREAGLAPVDLWISSDARPDRASEKWVNCIARRPN